jgi:hypothetical protein
VSKPKLSDVWFMSVTLQPVTTCEPPEGETCWLQKGSPNLDATAARRHALENPCHLLQREAVTRSRYHYEVPGEPANA